LMLQHLLELTLREHTLAHEDVAEPVASIDDARVRDAAAVEVDLTEARAVRYRQAPGLESECEQLADIGQTGFLEAALDRHATPCPARRCPGCTANATAASRGSGTSRPAGAPAAAPALRRPTLAPRRDRHPPPSASGRRRVRSRAASAAGPRNRSARAAAGRP